MITHLKTNPFYLKKIVGEKVKLNTHKKLIAILSGINLVF